MYISRNSSCTRYAYVSIPIENCRYDTLRKCELPIKDRFIFDLYVSNTRREMFVISCVVCAFMHVRGLIWIKNDNEWLSCVCVHIFAYFVRQQEVYAWNYRTRHRRCHSLTEFLFWTERVFCATHVLHLARFKSLKQEEIENAVRRRHAVTPANDRRWNEFTYRTLYRPPYVVHKSTRTNATL